MSLRLRCANKTHEQTETWTAAQELASMEQRFTCLPCKSIDLQFWSSPHPVLWMGHWTPILDDSLICRYLQQHNCFWRSSLYRVYTVCHSNRILWMHLSPVKRICVFVHSIITNFNCTCPAIQRGQGSGFLSEGSSWLTACMSKQRLCRLAWTFAARIGDKYQIRLTRSI